MNVNDMTWQNFMILLGVLYAIEFIQNVAKLLKLILEYVRQERP